MKWENFNRTKMIRGESFGFFYDEDKLRICTQKEKAFVFSIGGVLCRFDSSYIAF